MACVSGWHDKALAVGDEITAALGLRLKAVRLSQSLTQADLAERDGISVGTFKALERTGQSCVASLVRVVQTLGQRRLKRDSSFRPGHLALRAIPFKVFVLQPV